MNSSQNNTHTHTNNEIFGIALENITSVIVWKVLWEPLVVALLTWIWNHAIAIGTTIINTFLIHEHWKHFQCFHRKICTVVINVLLLLLILTNNLVFLPLFFCFTHRSIWIYTFHLKILVCFLLVFFLFVVLTLLAYKLSTFGSNSNWICLYSWWRQQWHSIHVSLIKFSSLLSLRYFSVVAKHHNFLLNSS